MKALQRLMLILAIFCLANGSSLALAAEMKLGYVDIEKIFDEYDKTKKFDKDLQEEGKGKQQKRDAIVAEVRKLKDEQALLSEEKKKEKQAAIEGKLKELDGFDEAARRELGEKRNVIM